MGLLLLASVRGSVADFVAALALVYTILIVAWVLFSLFVSFGGRIPYGRWSDALLGFLRDVVQPYLAIFRRIIPPVGPLDLSPIVAILLLQIVAAVVVNLLRG